MNEQHDSIEAALRVPEPALPDEDFSMSVLARLPPPRRRLTVRRWTVAGSAALGSALTLAFAAPLETVLASFAPWDIPPFALSTVAIIAMVALPALLVFYSERADR
jgi:predicted MFS family arabinose efflux permease